MTDHEILYAYGSGTTDLSRNKLVMQSQDFVIIRTPGHEDWAGVGSRAYYKSHTVLARKGVWCLRGDREEWYGRVSKKELKTALDKAQEDGVITVRTHGDFCD